jgi:hypothetical protein
MALSIALATGVYDRTRAFADGSVKIDGVNITHTGEFPGDYFPKIFEDGAFDAAEMALTLYVATLDQENPPFVAIPAFPVRFFRHSALYINRDSGIRVPSDLNGRRVGEMLFYGHDAGIWMKGILADEFGVDHKTMHHFIGGAHQAMPAWNWVPHDLALRGDVRVEAIGDQRNLGDMLEAGELDAVFTALAPPSFGKPGSRIERLFPNFEAIERDYYKRTGIFPIMHTVVIRREIYETNRWLARALFEAFVAAKAAAEMPYVRGATFMHTAFMMPWMTSLYEENRVLLGNDWWPYGMTVNRKPIDTFLRYHHAQGLSKRRYTADEIFAPETLDA